MGDFNKFLKDNKIQKQEIAKYLGVSNTFVTQLSKGASKLSPEKLEMILANKDWDCSALETDSNSGILISRSIVSGDVRQANYYSDSPDVLRAEIDKLNRIIEEKEERIKEKDAQLKEKDAQIEKLLNILSNK